MGALPEGEPPFGKMAKWPSHLWRFGHLLITFFLKCPSMPPSFIQGSPGSCCRLFQAGPRLKAIVLRFSQPRASPASFWQGLPANQRPRSPAAPVSWASQRIL